MTIITGVVPPQQPNNKGIIFDGEASDECFERRK